VVLVLAFLLTYKMADVVMFAMSKVFFARELGIGTALRGGLINPVATLSSIAGAIVGGAWIARRGLDKTLFPITLVMAVTAPLYALLAHFAPVLDMAQGGVAATPETLTRAHVLPLSLVLVTVVIEQLCGGLATAAQMVFIMRRCHPNHKAAHFAFATAVYSAAQMAVGAYSGALYEWVGPVSYFWIVTLLTLPALALSVVVAAPARS
jgi:PAT family beta-lactamase induction signal transducer AmpG